MSEIPRNPENERPVLSYEEFTHREESDAYLDGLSPPYHNNFFIHFLDVPKNHRRNKPSLSGLREENPDLERRLTEAITKAEMADRSRTEYVAEL